MGVKDSSRPFNYMPKRTFSFKSEIEPTEFLAKNSVIYYNFCTIKIHRLWKIISYLIKVFTRFNYLG